MAGTTPTTYARVRSSYVERQLERERAAVDICLYRWSAVLLDMQRALASGDEERISAVALDVVDAETALSMARLDLEEAEEA